jgi:WD40 repeat protein
MNREAKPERIRRRRAPILLGFFSTMLALPGAAQVDAGAAANSPRLDRHGDPLPPGAIARMGSTRLRATEDIFCIAFAPDGRSFATAGRENAVYLWNAETGREIERFGRPNDPNSSTESATDLAFSPDGKLLAVARASGRRESPSVEIFDLDRGALHLEIRLDADSREDYSNPGAASALFTPDSRHSIVGGDDGSVRLYTVETGDELFIRKWPEFAGVPIQRRGGGVGTTRPAHVVELALSPDGRTLAALAEPTSGAARLALWPLGSAEAPRVFDTMAARDVTGLKFSRDGRRIFTGGHLERWTEMDGARGSLVLRTQGGARAWDAATGEKLAEYRTDEENSGVAAMELLPDDRTLAILTTKGALELWNAESGERIAYRRLELTDAGPASVMALSPDGRRLAAAHMNALAVFDPTGEGPALENIAAHAGGFVGAVVGLAYTPDGKRLVSMGRENWIRVWDAATGELKAVHRDGDERVSFYTLAMSPDGAHFATAGADGVARIWEIESGRVAARLPLEGFQVRALAFSPDAELLAVSRVGVRRDPRLPRPAGGAADPNAPTIDIWKIDERERVGELFGPEVYVDRLWFAPDGERVMMVDGGGVVHIWERATGVLRFKFETGERSMGDYTIPPNGEHLVTIGATRKPLQVGRTGGSTSAGDNELIYWDVDVGEATRRIAMPGAVGRQLAIAPDARRAVTYSVEMTHYTIWDLESGREMQRIEPPRGLGMNAMAMAPDGRSFAVGLNDGTILIYPMPPNP